MAVSKTREFKHMDRISKRDSISLAYKPTKMSEQGAPANDYVEFPWQYRSD